MALLNDAGKLNQRCTFYSVEEYETNRGVTKQKEVEQFSCWCTIRQARLSEIEQTNGADHTVKTTLIIRHRQREEIQADWSVKIRGDMYEIVSLVPDYETQMFDMIVLRRKF